jgi:uncharacterized membrane protein YedE/YeeE
MVIRKKIIKRKSPRKIVLKTAVTPAISPKSSPVGSKWIYLGFGVLFGYFLSKARATDYDTVLDMFLFRDYQLWKVLIVAVAVTALGLFLLRWKKIPTLIGRQPIQLECHAFQPSRLIGAFLFGAGWAMVGACPATVLAQIGEGKLVAIVTLIGILAGVWAYNRIRPEQPSDDQVC